MGQIAVDVDGGPARRAGKGGHRVHALPAAGGVARAERGRAAPALPRPELLGEAAARVRRPARAGGDRRPGARPPTAAIGPAGSSPAIARATGSSPHCIGRASPTSPPRCGVDDGLRLRGAYVTAVNRCPPPQNRPTTEERDNCLPYLVRELGLLRAGRVIVALGSFAWAGSLLALAELGADVPRPRPRFGHGAEAVIEVPGRRARDGRSWAASTPPSRTPSPAGSPSR